jgi:hypothetical protein
MSIISAGTTTTTALSSTGNTDGTLQFQVNGTTASVTLNTLGAIGVGSTPAFGTAGQVLTSGGSTVAPAWTTISGSSQWVTTGSNIYYNTGNVSIGNTNPQTSLQVAGTGTASGGNAASSGYAALMLTDTTNNETYIHAVRPGVGWNNLNFGALTYTWRTNGGNVAMTFNSSNNLQLLNSLSVGNATPTTSGAGITFPATQSASTNANTLDDYEEGTWTPTVFGSTTAGTGTYGYQEGLYVKVGQMVMATAFISMNTNSGTGNIRFGGLPFALSNIGTNRQSAAIGYFNNCSLTASNIPLSQGDNGQIYLHLYQTPVGGGAANPVPMDTSFEISFTITYRCDA